MCKIDIENYIERLLIKSNSELKFHTFTTLCNEVSEDDHKVLNELSRLYEYGIITYPRVIDENCICIPNAYLDKKDEILDYFLNIFDLGKFKNAINRNKIGKGFDDRSILNHHGLTIKKPIELKYFDKLGLYERIGIRYLMQFLPSPKEYKKINKLENF